MAKKITNIQTVLNSNSDSRSDNLNLAIVTAPRIPEPVDPAKQQLAVKYIQNGLTVTSNNTSIHPRDEAGNIILQENSEQNPLLIIEPTATKISLNSMLRVLDTRFEYYKFPVIRTDVPELPELDLSDLVIEPEDPFYARYKPSSDLTIPGGPDLIASGILLDEVVAGLPQTYINSYTVNQLVKDSGKNLRVRATIKHKYDGSSYGYIYFFVARGGTQTLDREFAGPFANREPADYIFGQIYTNTTHTLYIDFIIENKDFEVGTTFSITAKTGQESSHVILSEGTFFTVTDASQNVDELNNPV
jgi:hypothetical protein